MRLTPEQTRLVEQNVAIVPSLVRTHTPPAPWTREDLMSAGYEALCKAAQRWNPSQGCTFASFAYRRINGAFIDEIRTLKFGSRFGKTDQPTAMSESLEPVAPDDYTAIEVRDLLSSLSQRDRTIIELRMEGVPSGDIAKKLGIHPSRISQIVYEIHQQMVAA